ncbi:hypothetical protein [Sphingomonas sp. 1P08PE]|uniref:hypothetical protein n=1 Tax=Sphingomonas sp. 1P08PE TaxID=554122 RepID=UPI00399FA72C
MTDDLGRVLTDRALVCDEAPAGLHPTGFDPSRDDYEDNDCANCSGEGFTYGCSWDWQCDTYDEGEGTCLCTRRCDWCSPPQHDPALRAVLAKALARDSDGSGEAGETGTGSTEGNSAGRDSGIAR